MPLNLAYKQGEIEFYAADVGANAVLDPKDAYQKGSAAVRAANKVDAAIVECNWNGDNVVLDLKERGKFGCQTDMKLNSPLEDDVALMIHTSGTTGRPKAVSRHLNFTLVG